MENKKIGLGHQTSKFNVHPYVYVSSTREGWKKVFLCRYGICLDHLTEIQKFLLIERIHKEPQMTRD